MRKVENNREQERWQIAEGMSRQFIQRWDIHARQLNDGRYVCITQPFRIGLMYLHLAGLLTLGTYLLDSHSRARFTVLDADDAGLFEGLKQAAGDLESQGVPAYLETSRRGGHAWLFFSEPISGREARGLGLGLKQVYRLEQAEVYPKQDQLQGGPGSLIRIPFGIHRKSGKRYGFIDPTGWPLGSLKQQVKLLSAPKTVPKEAFAYYRYRQPERPAKPAYVSPQVEQVKDIPLLDFIGRFVDLRPIASGGIGRCPFHEDHLPSFGVNSKGNYWYCFAGCGGGDLISFWMKWKNVDFKTAVEELKAMAGNGANLHQPDGLESIDVKRGVGDTQAR